MDDNYSLLSLCPKQEGLNGSEEGLAVGNAVLHFSFYKRLQYARIPGGYSRCKKQRQTFVSQLGHNKIL